MEQRTESMIYSLCQVNFKFEFLDCVCRNIIRDFVVPGFIISGSVPYILL